MEGGDRVTKAFMMEIEEAIRDCRNRPMLDEARTVTIKVEVKPVIDEDEGDVEKVCRDIQVQWFVPQLSRPMKKSAKIKMALIHGQNKAFFHADIPGDPRAIGLFDNSTVPADQTTRRPSHPEVAPEDEQQ
jgi:hypothetical protein